MKIGLYFGSFNPIHTGHLIIANHVLNYTKVEQIWFVLSPQNPLKKTSSLLNEYARLHLLQLAIETNSHFKLSDIEFKLPRPSYTIDTLIYLNEKYPKNEFFIIIGSDSYRNINKWKNSNILLKDYSFYVYNRLGFEITETALKENIHLLYAPLIEISSTAIRTLIHEGKSAKYLLSENVYEEIEKSGYYKK